ncbi:MAG: ATP-binding protein [Chloroflexota bacterium]
MELVDREHAFRDLDAAWQGATGKGGFVLISGEAGIGKTALVETFVRHNKQARHLWGACDALFSPRPLGPLYDIAAQTEGRLSRLLSAGAALPLIFSACLQELQGQPTIAVVEDIHWADEGTLDWLKYLGRRIHLTPSLLLVTFRDDALNAQHPLRLLFGDLATLPAMQRIPLSPLSPQGVKRLVGERPIDATALHRQTGGNPFYVTEVLAARAEGVLVSGTDGVPSTVRDAVLARAARLSQPGRAVLDAAAVIGPRIEPWLLAEVTRAQDAAVNECLDAGMLQAHGETLAFRHELARQAILAAIHAHRRLSLHRTVLAALRASPTTQQDAIRLAHHAEAAGDHEAILAYAPVAARAARAAGALRTAAALWDLAIRHSDDLPPRQRAEFYAAFASASHENPDRSQAITAHRRAVALGMKGGDLNLVANSLCRLAVLLLMEGHSSEAEQSAEEALELLEPQGASHALAVAHKVRAFLHLSAGEGQQAADRAAACLNVAAELESTSLHIEAYHALGICSLPLDHARGRDYLEKSLALVLDEKAYWAAGSVHCDLIMTCVDVYDLRRAEELIASGLEITAEHDLDLSWLVIQAWKAIVLVYRGRWDQAEKIAGTVLEHPRQMEVFRVAALVALGRLHARRGAHQAAQQALDEALHLSRQVNNQQRLGVVYTARAEAAWLAGNRERALREARAIYDVVIANRQPGFAAELAYWRWRAGETVETQDWMVRPFVLEIQGQWDGAAAAWEALGCPYEQARALAAGDGDAQLRALLIFEDLGARPMAHRVRQELQRAGVQPIPRGPRPTTRENPFHLTNRQLEVLTLLTENLTNAQIAARLHISPKTVDHHVSAILARLDVSSREEAAALARQHPDL